MNFPNLSKLDSPNLRVSFVEAILISCIDMASFYDIYDYLKRVSSDVTHNDAKEHLFYLISHSFITYDGNKGMYFTSQNGVDLLNEIYLLRKVKMKDYAMLTIKFQ